MQLPVSGGLSLRHDAPVELIHATVAVYDSIDELGTFDQP